MKTLLIASIILMSSAAQAEEKAVAPAPSAPTPKAEAPKNPESVDISGLEQDYWRPNKDELEVVQNRRFEKAKKFELALQYGIFQGQDYVDSKSVGGSLTYNFTNQFFTEFSYFKISNSDNDFLNSVRTRFGFTPDFNRENHQMVLSGGWTPIYAKFALLGKQISHFEMYLAPGIGITNTTADHLSGHLTIGQKFFITEHLLFRLEWRITKFTDQINTSQGITSKANGGPGFVDQSQTTHNIIFGLGVMY
jgi:outer membrane beta-barrel protein